MATLPTRNVLPQADADAIGSDPKFNTALTPEEQPGFAAWKTQNAPDDSGYDYDLQGAFKAGIARDPASGHFDDTFKKPNHPTFSTFSQYAKDRPDLAGTWDGDTWVPPKVPVPVPRPDTIRGGQDQPISGGTGQDAVAPNNLDDAYVQQVQRRDQQNSLDSLNQWSQQQAAGQPAAAPDQPIISQAAPTQDGADQTIGQKALSVVKDVGKGLAVEGVPAVLMGGEKAIQNTVDLVDSSLRFIEDKVGIPQPPERGPATRDVLAKLFGEPTTVTGKAIEGIGQFLIGWRNAGTQLRRIVGEAATTTVGRIAQSAAQAGLTGFEAFNAQEGKLGDALYKVGVPHNVLTDFLASHQDDSEAMGRFRQAVGTVVTGVPLDGLVAAAQAMRAARAAREVASPPAAPGLPAGTPLVSEAQIAGGSAAKPLVTRVAAGKPDDPSLGSMSASELADPRKLSASAIAGTAREAGAVAEPPIVRLYRGEGLRDQSKAMAGGAPATGRWFTTDAGEAAQYAKDNGGSVYYVDVTRKDLSGAASGATAPDRHFVLPDEAAARMQPLAADTPAFSARPATAQTGRGVPPLPRQQAANDRLYINFSRINTPDDIKAVIDDTAQALKPEIDAAGRGVRTFSQMSGDAKQIDAWEALRRRQPGEALASSEANIAARELWVTSANNLTGLAKTASENPSSANLFNFRRALAMHHAIQAQVLGARAEAARALASWRIPVGSDAIRAQQINDLLRDSGGGVDASQELAIRVAALRSDPQQLEQLVSQGWAAKARGAVLKVWINGLLSGPKTHLVNTVSNLSVALMQMGETATARGIARLLGDDQGVQAGETIAQLVGLIQGGGKEGLVNAWQTLKLGQSQGLAAAGIANTSKAGEALDMAGSSTLGRYADTLETIIGGPGRLMGAEDAYFKSIGYRMELNRLAARQAGQEVNAGTIRPDQLKGRIADIIGNPPDSLKLDSINAANYATFNQAPGRLASLIGAAKGQYPALNLLLPFTRTPANILNFAVERSPLAPLLSKFRADYAAGGARMQLALAKMATGTAVMQVTADMALNNVISGRGPANVQTRATMVRAGWQPYSVKVGDRWYAYNRFDPIGMTIGQAADMVELLHNTEWDPRGNKDVENVLSAVALSVANNALNKTYMQGLSQFMAALNDPERAGMNYFESLAGSLVPTGVADVNRTMVDTYQREVGGMIDAIRSRTPNLSPGLAPRYDMWGRPMTYQSGLGWAYDLFSPIYSRREKPEEIDREILHQGWMVQEPGKNQGFNGININLANYPHVWSYWKWLQGQGVKDAFGHSQLDTLNGFVNGKNELGSIYAMRTDGVGGGKQGMVTDAMAKFRDLARQKLLSVPIGAVPASVQGELAAFRAEYRQRAESKPPAFQGMSPPPVIGVLP